MGIMITIPLFLVDEQVVKKFDTLRQFIDIIYFLLKGKSLAMSTTTNPVITEDDVRKIAHLARLKVDESAISRHVKSLSDILTLIAHINQLDTSQVTAMSSSLD